MGRKNSPSFRVALISMPWSIFNRPSIQLGALRSYLVRESNYIVDNYHPYLHLAKEISTKLYSEIALSGWAGEALFAPLLFPEKRVDAGKLFRDTLKGKIEPLPDFDQIVSTVDQSLKQWLNQSKLDSCNLIGFSICFSQLLPSLFLAREIKRSFAHIPVVFGGSSCVGEIGKSLIHHFPEIDYIIDGEGEQPLLSLCHYLSGENENLNKRVFTKENLTEVAYTSPLLQLNDLPYPDYSPYFKEVQQLFANRPFIPLLPIEFSRGCWWNKCTFCNLNLQWKNYRFKEEDRMAEEILHLAKKHQCLHFTFTDNALPPGAADRFFKKITKTKLDFDFFAEIRGITEPEKLQLYSKAGLTAVQVGIEALSNSLLKKMVKGTTVMDNIAMMKMCSGASIRMEGNLIVDFPTSTEEEITETLRNLDFVLPYLPLHEATYFLGYGSPIHALSKDFQIKKILPHAKNRKLFPENYLESMTMLINSYSGDKKLQKTRWQPVKMKIRRWQKFHDNRAKTRQHPLYYRDGSTFLIIRQERITGDPFLHRLRGTSKKIYLRCECPIPFDTLRAEFPMVNEAALERFIDEMCSKHLMFRENNRILSLAVPYTNN